MDLHEYQTKSLLLRYGVTVPEGVVCRSPQEAFEVASRLCEKGQKAVVKAQILAGGRGKAGGVIVASEPCAARTAAQSLLGRTLVTPQTGPGGKIIRSVYIEQACSVEQEIYLALTLNRGKRCVSCISSLSGGVNIEDPSASSSLFKEDLEISYARESKAVSRSKPSAPPWLTGCFAHLRPSFLELVSNLQSFFFEQDLLLLEINPLGMLSGSGGFIALDAKASVDDNALYRHPELEKLRDWEDLDSPSKEALRAGLSYVGLDGDIGCMVNGAGLAMATLDLIKEQGGNPANFLDIGGGVSEEGIGKAFSILAADRRVKAIFVNIFGGIVRCDLVAASIIKASRAIKVPMVVRLQGSQSNEAGDMLRSCGLPIEIFPDLAAAAARVVELAHEHSN